MMSTGCEEQQTADLWLQIDQHHLNYLKSDDSTRKIDVRKKLEGFIHQYLCLVPHDRKFCNLITSDILFQSSRWLANFSSLTAARAFEAVEKYAANLLNQPWRKEFREIKQYGGFYKHEVEQYLSCSERLFHLMGYVSTGQQTLMLHGPIDQDKVTTVARDCVLAFVECQIIAGIVQGVSAHLPCSWEEAMVFRRDHIGTPEQAVRSLIYLKNQSRFQHNLGLNHSAYYPAPPSFASSYPQIYFDTYGSAGLAAPAQVGPVPTAKLLDLGGELKVAADVVGHSSSSSTSTLTDRQVPIPLTIKQLEEENKRKSLTNGSSINALESWDYVYKQLESIGYTKDQADRPDVLNLLSQMARQKQIELLQAARYLAPTQPQSLPAASQKFSTAADGAAVRQRQASPDTYSSSPISMPHSKERSSASGDEVQRDRQFGSGSHTQPALPPRCPGSAEPPPKLPEKTKNGQRAVSQTWECKVCTYRNHLAEEVCAMCYKSRLYGCGDSSSTRSQSEEYETTNDSDAAAYDDRVQCCKCTLLNDPSHRICEACGATLRFSPIYH